MRAPVLYFVIPCYNEEDCLRETTKRLKGKITTLIEGQRISKKSKIIYIDDGSKDKTWEIIKSFGKRIIGLKLSRNCGHQNALAAGLLFAKGHCDAAISMDADLQDDINTIDSFIAEFRQGAEIVYGVRSDRKHDSFFKKNTALLFYKLMNLLGAKTVFNHADYRLMSNRALEEFSRYKEVNLFLRGIVPTLGLKTATVYYERAERFAGKSKYPLRKMVCFAAEGITSFSIKPIRLVFFLGLIIDLLAAFMFLYAIIVKLAGQTVPGWAFLLCSIWFLGGIQMTSLGIIGEYIGKIYSEVKRRPRFIIEEVSKK